MPVPVYQHTNRWVLMKILELVLRVNIFHQNFYFFERPWKERNKLLLARYLLGRGKDQALAVWVLLVTIDVVNIVIKDIDGMV